MLKPLTLFLALTLPAQAEDAILATLHATSGSLPPPHAWSISVTIGTNGLVTAKRCKGYETDGPACVSGTATTTPAALDAIRSAARTSGLAKHPAAMANPPMVGGGVLSGTVTLDGQRIELVAQPAPGDAERVNTVIEVVGAAIPRELDRILSGD